MSKSKPTLVYVSSPLTSSFAGGERYTQKMVQGLTQFNHIFIGSSRAMHQMFLDNNLQSHLSSAGFEPVTPLNILLFPFSVLLSFWQIIKHYSLFKNADWVISPTSFTESFFLCPLLILLMKKPTLLIIHNNQCPKSIYQNPLSFLLKWTMNHSQVVFVSEVQKKEWQNKGFVPRQKDKISIIGYGLEKTKPQTSTLKTKEINLGFVARLHPEKGLQTIFKALPTLANQKPIDLIINLNIAGEGDYKTELQYLQKSLQIDENWQLKNQVYVNWLGFIKDINNFYTKQNLIIFPSLKESFGIVLLEAWSNGKPVLTSDIAIFKHLKNYAPEIEKNLIFETQNPTDLTFKIINFIQNRGLFENPNHIQALQKIVDDNFSEQQMLDKYTQIIQTNYY
jgi:glycosyltransferase involved in cell wall biosynthesis